MPIQHVEKVAVTTLNFADVGGGANARRAGREA